MTNLEEAVANLLAAIKDTEEYREYSMQKEKVAKFPELKAQLDDFRKKSRTDSRELFDKIEEFQQEKEDLIEDPLAEDFLAAELNFCRMIQEVELDLTDGLDFM